MKKLTLSLTALLLALWPAFAGAETPAFVPLNPAAVNKKLDAAATKLNSGKAGKEEIAAILQEVAGIEDDRQQTRQQYAEELASVQKKLNALGPAPEKDESEPAAIAKQRKEFAGKADGYKAQIAQMDLLAARIDEINGLILKIRNRRLLDNILVKQSSIFHPEEFWQSLTTFAGFVFELVKSPFSWYRGLPPEKEAAVNNNILTVIGVMAGALVAAFFLSRYIRSRLGYRAAVEHPDYSQKVRAGIAMFIVRGVIPAAVIGAFLFWLKGNGVVNTGSFGLLLHTANMVKIADFLAGMYPETIDRSLLLTGTLLHDMAKAQEFVFSQLGLATDYSIKGQLLGHLVMGAQDAAETAARLGVPEEKSVLLQHLILSHHGEPEFGAAVRPLCAEAELLSLIDAVDSRMEIYRETYDTMEPDTFSPRIFALEKKVFRHA